jgi:hypothetical protein
LTRVSLRVLFASAAVGVAFEGCSNNPATPYASYTPKPTQAPQGPTPTPSPSPTPAGPTPTPAPTATPTPSPTPTGPPAIVLSTYDLILCGAGSGPNTGTFTATETGYTGLLTATSANTAIATVTPATVTSGGTFTATEVATQPSGGLSAAPGTTIAVTDTLGHTSTVAITPPYCIELP